MTTLNTETIQKNLQQMFPNQVLTDADNLQIYGKDWTYYFNIQASAVVFPQSTEDVQKLVHWARENKVKLIPSGGRTGLSGAAVATNFEVIVSFEKMTQILEENNLEQSITVQAGAITENLQKRAQERGFYFPVDFASRGSSQIGGNIATNAGGIKVVRYGLMRDWVLGLKVVTGAGEVLELNNSLIKNATGYDLRQLFIGSEGTLGFITEATIKLASPPPPLKVMLMGTDCLESVMKVFEVFKKHITLSAFEMFSDKALNLVKEHAQLPHPIEQECAFYILAEIECPHESAEEKMMEAFSECLENNYIQDGILSQSEVQAKSFWRYREDITESCARFFPYKNDLAVRISRVPEFVADLDLVLQKEYPHYKVIWFGHIGDGNLHISILRPQGMTKEEFFKECQKVDQFIFGAVKKHQGSISAEHGVGLTKKPFLGFTRSPEEIAIMKSIKQIFDPDQILNPGKIF